MLESVPSRERELKREMVSRTLQVTQRWIKQCSVRTV